MDLNHRPPRYKRGALTAELYAQVTIHLIWDLYWGGASKRGALTAELRALNKK